MWKEALGSAGRLIDVLLDAGGQLPRNELVARAGSPATQARSGPICRGCGAMTWFRLPAAWCASPMRCADDEGRQSFRPPRALRAAFLPQRLSVRF
jgi:hypothetical protein